MAERGCTTIVDGIPFLERHLGPNQKDIQSMLDTIGYETLDELSAAVVPDSIRVADGYSLREPETEQTVIERLGKIAKENTLVRSLLGQGYYDTNTPAVIQRNILENPGWYTQYTPYQAEIAQGRLEALFNFQTMVCELTGLEIANGSMLDEATAAAEAMMVCARMNRSAKTHRFFLSNRLHPQTLAVMKTRAQPLGYELTVGELGQLDLEADYTAIVLQYPDTRGEILDYRDLAKGASDKGTYVIAATDLLALTILEAPGKWGADIAVGNSQRFGVPLGYGGPHAAFMAAKDSFKRNLPGRIVGESLDRFGRPALRLALQTREQHIRREKATSNICTAQVLLAIMASMYAVYHGPDRLKNIANTVRSYTGRLRGLLAGLGFKVCNVEYFDTLAVEPIAGTKVSDVISAALKAGFNLRRLDEGSFGITLDEKTDEGELTRLSHLFSTMAGRDDKGCPPESTVEPLSSSICRTDGFLSQEVFGHYHSETEFLRYLNRLQSKDLSLANSMIPLGSCTMKLNATTEMLGVTWPEFANLHPCVPRDQAKGYDLLFEELEESLATITGLPGVALQPNAGSQGEYAGMLVIQAYHSGRGEEYRNVCIIPESAHGTNPASAMMAGMKVVVVKCDDDGNIDMVDLQTKAEKHSENLAAAMITYPSTHGVFETHIREICETIHANGGQVYLDGANLNAQVGLCRPGDYGADVCHLNLHKTFCIPHGGGGPGMGPIAVAQHLRPFLPGHPMQKVGGEQAMGAVSAAPWGSPAILPISWAYIMMLGWTGLKKASQVAILNANYMAKKLEGDYEILFTGNEGLVAHEFIVDLRQYKSAGVEVEDIAKRLMDYGFHAPTISWPVAGTMMVEPTESESKRELDRFCEALLAIRTEIQDVVDGKVDVGNNVLKNAPHTARCLTVDEWNHPYSRQQAVYPGGWATEHKFWPAVGRIDNVYGDRNLVCSCPPLSDYVE